MTNINTNSASRRSFLRGASAFAAAGLGTGFAFDLAGFAAASAQTAPGYKALVCMNLSGGNDHLTSFVPYDAASNARYAQVRGGLAIPRNSVLPISAASAQNGLQIAINPQLAGVKALYDLGRVAIMAGVGPLLAPVTRDDIAAGRAPLPRLLGSHLDQQNTWQSLGDTSAYGWGGRFGDLLAASNTRSNFTTISAAGYSLYSVGAQTSFFTVSEGGAPRPFFEPGSRLDSAITGSAARTNLLEREYSRIHEGLRDGAGTLNAAMVPDATFANPSNGRNNMAQQLKTVARIIGGNRQLGVSRQVFYVEMGGFDTHLGQNDRHPGLMTDVNDAMVYFDELLGQIGMRDSVTAFTMSDFGRNFVPNGDGTDHGWGAHHLVMGGAVNGGNIYGRLPVIDVAGPDFVVGGGQMIPTTSASQYAATLGRWMGVGDADLRSILPDLARFNSADVGFMR
jgi:uncharacterized protein (DUF1501 family)